MYGLWYQQLMSAQIPLYCDYSKNYLDCSNTKKLTNFVYLASPFSHKSLNIEEKRYIKITKIAGKLTKKYGYTFFCPITQSYNLKKYTPSLGTSFEAWEKIDLEAIRRSDEIWVILMKGWDKSIGVQAEIEYAKSLNMKVRYLNPKTLQEVEVDK